jgi:hypothetical protein
MPYFSFSFLWSSFVPVSSCSEASTLSPHFRSHSSLSLLCSPPLYINFLHQILLSSILFSIPFILVLSARDSMPCTWRATSEVLGRLTVHTEPETGTSVLVQREEVTQAIQAASVIAAKMRSTTQFTAYTSVLISRTYCFTAANTGPYVSHGLPHVSRGKCRECLFPYGVQERRHSTLSRSTYELYSLNS